MDTANVGYSYHLPSGGWNYKIRNTLSQFSDLFSEFNKYIAPAYHHDRCERSVQMRIYSMHKGEFVMVFIAFFACFGLGVFIGLAGPSPTSTTSERAVNVIVNTTDIYQGPIHLHSPAFSTRVQQLWLLAQILTDNDDEEIFDKSFQISIAIEGVVGGHVTVNIIPETGVTNRTLHLKCKKQICEEIMILHLGSLEYTHYVLNIQMYGLKEFHYRYNIRDIVFYFKTYNPAFTQMETWFRFIFLLTTFTVACWFAHTLRKYSTQDWAIEQKWLSILLPLLLLYNEHEGRTNKDTFSFIISVRIMTVPSFWSRGGQNERGFVSFYLFKVIIVGLVWLPAMVVAVWQKYYAYYDPTFNYYMSPNYPMVKIMFFVAVTLYFLYLLVLIVKAYSDLRNMPFFGSVEISNSETKRIPGHTLTIIQRWWVGSGISSFKLVAARAALVADIRLRVLSAVVGTVSLAGALLAARGWGPAALQDHWAAQPAVHYDTSAPFMAQYGLFNFTLYTLAYLLSPGTGSIHETAITKDNPAFSMINDSDEDVIYGSDEESRRPLNSRSHRATSEDI
ncbi:jg5147 [Pararge aegeria aegeria]|uniref:Jg5147 protein n=1 Tax=Pararge aegeria aegeria TaxID=348720 RepID=A0A8S4S0I4_9NEOP|nr:jg5147 [Pararge aegeria aegeria]